MRDPTRPWTSVVLTFLLIIFCTTSHSDATPMSVYERKKDKSKSSKPTTPPAPTQTSVPPIDVEIITFENEIINLVNVGVVPMEDIDALFEIQKDWIETYFREQDRRLRALQNNDRRRDSRDITTQFEFVKQNSNTGADGKPNNQVTYNQKIGFGPSRRHRERRRRRNLVEINVDDRAEVYEVSTRPYRDLEALNELTSTLRENVDSLSAMDGIYKLFDPVRVQPPLLGCGSSCQEGSQLPLSNTTSNNNDNNSTTTDPN